VQSGSHEAGALNVQVWQDRLKAGTVDLDKVQEVLTTPNYHDYHWIAGPGAYDRLGEAFTGRLRTALLDLDGSDPAAQEVLDRYRAKSLAPTAPHNYDQIEQIARQLGLLQ
jgi:phosphonate transport system substrate-binding protein